MRSIRRLIEWRLSWPFDYMVAMLSAATGVIIMLAPERGIEGYVKLSYNVPVELLGFAMIVSAGAILMRRGPWMFWIACIPMRIHALFAIMYLVDALVYQKTNATVTAVPAWIFIVWITDWLNYHRSKNTVDRAENATNTPAT